MKIVISTAVYYPMINGVAVFSHNLAQGLARRGHEVIVLTPSQKKKSFVKTEGKVKVYYLKSVDAKVYPDQIHAEPRTKIFGRNLPKLFYKNGFKVSLFPYREVTKILKKFQPDVIHVQVSDPIGLSVVFYARKNQIPVVTTEHNEPEVLTDPLKLPGFIKKPTNVLLSSYFRNRQSKSDYVTMPTQLAIDRLFQGKDLGIPIEAVSNGVDLTKFRPDTSNNPNKLEESQNQEKSKNQEKKPESTKSPKMAAEELLSKYQIPKNRPTVLYVGRVDPEKKVGTVLAAFSEVLTEVPEAILLIIGDGVDKDNLIREALNLGIYDAVYFLGRVLPPDLYEFYRLGDVFATASEIETQGIVLIEAAASGLPLVAVNAGAVAEICHDKENGFLLEPGDIEGISKSLISILTDEKLRRRFSQNSLKLAREHDFECTLDKFEEIYEKVVSKGK